MINPRTQLDINNHEFTDETFDNVALISNTAHKAKFVDCVFKRCDFSSVFFRDCEFHDCHFEQCNLSMIKINQSVFNGVAFKNCKMIGINWTSAAWSNMTISVALQFHECLLNDSSFYGLPLQKTKFEYCRLHDVDFSEADCEEADFSYSDLTNSLFHHTNLQRANFAGAFHYQINILNNRIKNAKFSLPEALSLLSYLEIKLVD